MATARRNGVEPTWLAVARHFMPDGMSTNDLYAACGWSQGSAYWRRRSENLKLSTLFVIAAGLKIPLGVYVEALAKALKMKRPSAIAPPPRKGRKVDRITENQELARALAEIQSDPRYRRRRGR